MFRFPVRLVTARPRLFLCGLAGAAIGLAAPGTWPVVVRALLGWDAAVLLYLTTVGWRMMHADGAALKRRAQETDEGRYAILVGGILATGVSIGAIIAQLGLAKDLHGAEKALHVGLAAGTVILSWFFVHFIFALHYTNEFFFEVDLDGDGTPDLRGGLHFPGTKEPRYIDFLYYAYTIGVASQTADVETTSQSMRMITLSQSIVAFFFNTAILALAINIAAGLL